MVLKSGEEDVGGGCVGVVGGVETHADRGGDPEHPGVGGARGVVLGGEVELFSSTAYEEVSSGVAGDLRVGVVGSDAVGVDLVGELVVVEGGSVFRHRVRGREFQRRVGQRVGAWPGVHEGVEHHLGGLEVGEGEVGSCGG